MIDMRADTSKAVRVGVAVMAVMLLSWAAPRTAFSSSIESTFSGGLDGWTTNDASPLTWVSSGGNPDGFAYLDNCECDIAQLIAPSQFLGDLSAFFGGTLSFDGNLLGNGGTFFDGPNSIPAGPYLDYGILELVGSTTLTVDLSPNGATPALGSWQTYSVGLTGAAWGVTDAQLLAVLQNVTALRITVEGLWGSEIEGVDNVRLESPAVPEPTSLSLVLLAGGVMAAMRGRRTRRT